MNFLVAITQTENYDFLGSDSANYENYRDEISNLKSKPIKREFFGRDVCVDFLFIDEQDFCQEGETYVKINKQNFEF